jgi:hypothetical protein
MTIEPRDGETLFKKKKSQKGNQKLKANVCKSVSEPGDNMLCISMTMDVKTEIKLAD